MVVVTVMAAAMAIVAVTAAVFARPALVVTGGLVRTRIVSAMIGGERGRGHGGHGE